MMLLAVEVNPGKTLVAGDEQHAALGAFKPVVVAHGHSFASDCHKCMTA
jgi:hypothetical protein